MNEQDLARELNITPALVNYWVTDKYKINKKYFSKLSNIYEEYKYLPTNNLLYLNILKKLKKLLTRKKLAEMLGVSVAIIYHWEKNEKTNKHWYKEIYDLWVEVKNGNN